MSLRSTLFSTLLAGAATVALAQNPSAPLTIVVPYPAGGPLDTSARIVADGAAAQLGSITVENKPGAGGNQLIAVFNSAPQQCMNFLPEPQTQGCFMPGSGTVGSIKYQRPATCTKTDTSWWLCRPCGVSKSALNATSAWCFPACGRCDNTVKPAHCVVWLHVWIAALSSQACCAGTVVVSR